MALSFDTLSLISNNFDMFVVAYKQYQCEIFGVYVDQAICMISINPEVDWGDTKQWEDVYEPSSDTFLLCDGVKELSNRIKSGSIILEVGSGSGYATAYAYRLMASLNKFSFHFATDINMKCCLKTYELCARNGALVAPFCDEFAQHFRGKIDVVMFNPPYVETPDDELASAQKERGIAASWAGGQDGSAVIYEFLRFILDHRNKFADDFLVILLISIVNKPMRLQKYCRSNGLKYETILDRNCQGEHLKIVALSPHENGDVTSGH